MCRREWRGQRKYEELEKEYIQYTIRIVMSDDRPRVCILLLVNSVFDDQNQIASRIQLERCPDP